MERGVTFFATAECCGPFTNEELMGAAVAGIAVQGARSPEHLQQRLDG